MIARRLLPLVLAFVARQALAGGDPNAGEPLRTVLPYAGHLDFNGVPFDGVLQMAFAIHVTENGNDFPLFSEVDPAVQVHDGSFNVVLGNHNGVDAATLAAALSQDRQLWLDIAVRPVPMPGEDPPFVPLHPRQALHPSGQALWAAKATNLTADNVTLTGALTAASVGAQDVTTRRLSVQDQLSLTGNDPVIAAPNLLPGAGVEMMNPLVIDGSLRTASVQGRHGNVDVGENLTVTGTTTLHGNTTIDMFAFSRQQAVNGGAQEHCVASPAEAQNMCFLVGMQGLSAAAYCYWDPQFGFCAQNATCYFGCLRIRP